MLHFIRRFLTINHSWFSLFEGAIACTWVYVFLEWLFIVTKPSFFSAVPLEQKIRVLLFGAALLTVLVLLSLAGLFLITRVIRSQPVDRVLRGLGALALALILASLGLLLVDNFTNTVFGFGIASTSGWSILPYLSGFLLLIGYLFLDVRKGLHGLDHWLTPRTWRRRLDLGLAVFLIAALGLTYQPSYNGDQTNIIAPERLGRKSPNILLITADGLDANHTSLHGYERDTTPQINILAEDSLVALNAYNNAGNTMGSVVSMYTGKYPTTTRTLYAPDILKGENAYQHLPNILRQLGYYNVQYTYPHHADAYARNVLAGFDEANGKSQQNLNLNYINRHLATDSAYFLYELGNRLVDRLRHIIYNKRMLTQQEIMFGETLVFHDKEKVARVFQVLSASNQPVFAHIHWMGTHGPLRAPSIRNFSKNKDVAAQPFFDDDFYDDSILDFDGSIGQVVEQLKSMGIYDNTILIISSDHSENNGTVDRIPLMIRFPNGEYKRLIHTSVQIIDLPPTLLDYLGVQQPVWMEGVSLLHGAPEERPIFALGVGTSIKLENGEVITDLLKPPFYQFGMMSVVYCGAWYELDLTSYQWRQGAVDGAVDACPDSPTDATVLGWMRDRLAADGFDVSSLGEVSLGGQ